MSATVPRRLPITVIGRPDPEFLTWPRRNAYTTRFSSRHDRGGSITFGDGHAASNTFMTYPRPAMIPGIKDPTITAGHDPGHPEINWDVSG